MEVSDPLEHRRWLTPALIAWWSLLLAQVWWSWDLNEVYASVLPLLLVGPERPFGALGLALGLIYLGVAFRRGAHGIVAAQATTLVVASWIVIASPVPLWGAHLHLLRHESRFVEEMESALATSSPDSSRCDRPVRQGVFLEGDPPRFGFDQRWIGAFHWTAIVRDPHDTFSSTTEPVRFVFDHSLLAMTRLRDDWYVVSVMK